MSTKPAIAGEQRALIDPDVFAAFLDRRSTERVLRLLDLYRGELLERAQALTQVIERRDAHALQMSAHALRGTGSMLGAARLVEVSTAIEAMCTQTASFDQSEAERLRDLMVKTSQAFAPYCNVRTIANLKAGT